MMDHVTETVGKNPLVTAAIRAAIDHAQRYGDRETAADLACILDKCVGASEGNRNNFSYPPFFGL
jgi:hypothetical protein